jgi:lipoprotein NlpI
MQRPDRKELTRSAALVDHTKWPSPILDYLLGKLDEQQLQLAANTGTDDAKRQQSCEANAYVGAERFTHSRDDGARQLLEKAVGLCPPDLIEKELAAYELGRP